MTSSPPPWSHGRTVVKVAKTDGYSGSDLKQLCASAASAPLRELMFTGRDIASIKVDEIPPVALKHMEKALSRVRSSVQPSELVAYETWNAQFGSKARTRRNVEKTIRWNLAPL